MQRIIRNEMRRRAAEMAEQNSWGRKPAVPPTAWGDKVPYPPAADAWGKTPAVASSDENTDSSSLRMAEDSSDVRDEAVGVGNSPTGQDGLTLITFPAPAVLKGKEWEEQYNAKLMYFRATEVIARLAFSSRASDMVRYMRYLAKRMKVEDPEDTFEWWMKILYVINEINSCKIKNRIERDLAEMSVEISIMMSEIPTAERHLKQKLQLVSVQIELARALKGK